MNKNRSTWASLLSLVLAVVVMAGLAVTAFAVTDGGAGNESAPVVDSVDELAAVLDGTQDPEPNVNYDVDGNGIVERDDLTVLKHQKEEGDPLPDLLPSGGNDWLGTLDDGTEDYAFFQSAIVRGDSTKAIHVSAKSADLLGEGMEGYAALSYYSAPIDFTGYAALTFDTFWPNGAGSLTVTLYDVNMAYEPYTVTVNATNAGWSTVIIGLEDIPAEFLASVASVDFVWDGEHELYIDNLQLAEANVTYSVGANGVTKLFDKFVIAGQPYGELPTPVRPFYTFVGWYADAEYENAVTADTIVAAGDSYTLYAKWEAVDSDTPMSEGGKYAILSVIDGKDDTYLYSVETASKYEDRYLAIDITKVTASVVSIDFKFTSVKDANGAAINDGLHMKISDRQISGVFTADTVYVEKETGTPVTTMSVGVEYTAYVTLRKDFHSQLKVIPFGDMSDMGKNCTYALEISAPVEHHDAPTDVAVMRPDSASHGRLGWYITGAGNWEYYYTTSNAMAAMSYSAGHTSSYSLADYREIVLTGVSTATEVRFDFMFTKAMLGDEQLLRLGTTLGTLTVRDASGNEVAEASRQLNTWYTAVITNDGAAFGKNFMVRPMGSENGTDEMDVQADMLIKNLRVKQAIKADDGSVTINGALYNANDRDNAITILHEDVQPFAVSISKAGAKQMRFKFKLTDAANFAISYVDSDSIAYNNPNVVIVDEDSNAVKAANVVAGKWYTAIVYSEIERYTNDDGTFWSSGEMCKTGALTINTAGDLQIKEAEALSGLFGFRLAGITIDMTRLDLSTLDYPGCKDYKYGYSINVNETNKYDTRLEFLNQRGLYNQLTFDFCITDFNGNTTAGADAELWFEGLNTTIYDQAGNALASHKDMVVGTWYTVKCDIADVSGSEYAVSLYSFGEANATRLPYKAYLANINWTAADVMFDHEYTVKTATLERSGNDGLFQVDRVTKYDGRATYEVTASSANWSDRALKLSLLDSDKDFIQLDFCYTVSRNADGKHVAPSMNVYTNLAGNPLAAQYVIVDANDNPVTELVTGNWYRMFITANGNTQFAIVPETEGWVRVQFNELETFAADEMNVAVTSDDPMNVSSSLLLDRFGDMRYGYANYAGNTGVLTFTPNASTYKQIRFNFLLKEVGTPAMSVNNGTISITDASGEAVAVADLAADIWYTAVITNSGNAIPTSVKLTVGSGNTRMVIKDLKAYDTTDAPAAGTVHSVFHGLEDGEMMIAGFLGPREEYYNVHGVAKPPMIRDEIFKLLAESGINYIDDNSFSYSGTQLEVAQDVLRLASKYNLNYFIGATDIANIGAIASSSENAAGYTVYTYSNYVAPYATFAAKLDELTQYKSFGGLHLRDEPSADLFLKIGEALKHIEDYNTANGTKLEGFVNLLPGVGSHRWTNGQTIKDANGNTVTISTWSDYVRAYADMADPNFLSFDMYPIQGEAGQIEYAYFNFLGYFATVAKEKGLPMAVCIQVGGGEPSLPNKRQANTDEMHWNVNTSLAFGAEAMTYFIMVEPPYYGDNVNADTINSHTAININGEPTPYYDAIKAINTNVKSIDHVIVNGTHKGVIFNGTMPNTMQDTNGDGVGDWFGTAPYDGTQLTKSAAKLTGISGNALIGVYDYEGKTALYVVNNSITSANTIGLTFTGNYTYEIISEGKTSWATGSSLSLNLAIGRGAMVIVHTSSVSTDVTVAFELNYETTTPNPAGKLLTTGNAYGELPTPVRPFYTFDGWYMNAECTGDEVTSTTTMTAMGDHALYAKWVEADLAITQTNVNHSTLTAGDELGTYVYTSNVTGASVDSRSLQLDVNVTGKEIVKFSFKFTTSLAADGSDLTPDMYVGDVYNGYWRRAESAITDENGKPVANLVAGKWYTMWITTEGQTSFRIFPMGQIMSQQVNAEMLIKDLEAVDVEIGSYFVSNDGGTFGPVGLYQDASGNWGYFTSAYDRYSAWLYEGTPKNLADYRKIRLKLDASDYTMATFQFQYQVSHYMAEGSTEWVDNLNLLSGTSNHTITVYDADGNEVAAANRKIGQWYTAVVKNTAGNVANTVVMYTCGYSGTNDKQVVEMEMLVKNIQGYKATTQPVYNNADNSVSVESAGIIDVLTQDGNNIRYQLTADKIPYLSGSNAIKVKLLNTTKQVISMKFTVNTLTDASGAASTPWTRVVTGSGNEANYAVIDEDGNLVKNIAAGKTYTLFITSPEFATNLYSKPSVPTEFVVYPVGMDTQSVADITFTEIAAHAVSGFSSNEGAITHTTTMVHNNLSYYKVGDQWNFSFSASETLFRGNTTAVSTAFTPAASATTLTLPSGSIKAVSMRVRYVEGMNNGAESYNMAASCTITFYDDAGNVVAAADREAGQWYNVSLTNLSSNTVTIYPAGHNLKNAAVMLQVADVTVMAEDTNPVTIASTETSWVTLTYELVNGSPAYTFNSTAYAAANSSSAWQRCLTLTNPLDKAAVLTMDFKFLSNTDGDGNSVVANMAAYTNASTPTNYAIMDKETGKLVGSCEMGKEYTLFINAAAGATVRVHTDVGHAGTVKFQMVITGRQALETPADSDVYVTSDSIYYGNVARYYVDGEWRYAYTSFCGTLQYRNAQAVDYREIQLKKTAGIYNAFTFEVRYDVAENIAADGTKTEVAKPVISGAKYYDANGNEVTTLTTGQWYRVVVTTSTTFAANTSMHPLGYAVAADTGYLNGAISFRNFVALRAEDNTSTITTPAAMADPYLYYTEADGWYYNIVDSGSSIAADQRYANITLPEDGMCYLDYEVRFNNISGEAAAYVGLMQGVNTFYEMDGTLVGTSNSARLETGKWYRVHYATNNAVNMGTAGWNFGYLGGFGAGNASVSLRNFVASGVQSFAVSFDANYDGAESIDSMTVKQGAAYGTLPTPAAREYYNFVCWTLEDGTAVTKDTTVSAAHTLYAKWELKEDTNPVTIASGEKSWVTLTYELVNGKPAYTFNSTAYAAANSSSAWQRCLTLTNPLDEAAVLTMDFKFLSNTDGDGNSVAANLVAYSSATAALNSAIMDKETGKLVGKCEMGKEYTLFISAAAGATVRVHTDVGHAGTTSFQMVITDRAALKAPANGDSYVAANSSLYGPVTPYYADGEWRYAYTYFGGTMHAAHSSEVEYRQIFLKQTAGIYNAITFEFKYDVGESIAADGTRTERIAPTTSNAKYYDMNGNQVTTFTLGTWYRAIITSASTFGASQTMHMMAYDRVPTDGELNTAISFRNFVALKAEDNTSTITTPAAMADPYLYYTEADGWYWNIVDSGSSIAADQRYANITLPEDGMTFLSYEVRINSVSGSAEAYVGLLSGVNHFFEADTGKWVGQSNSARLEAGKWYRVHYATNNSANMGTAGHTFGYLGGFNAGNASVSLRNFNAFAADTNNAAIAVNSGESGWCTLYPRGEGENVFVTKDYAAANASSAYQRSFLLTNNLETAAVLKMDFKFITCTDGNGNDITPSLIAHTDASVPSGYAIMEKDTGKLVGSCEVGKWYTIFVEADAGATKRIHVNAGYSGTVKIQMLVANREALEAPTAGDVTLAANSLYYGNLSRHYVDGEWRYGYTSYAGKSIQWIHNVTTNPQDVDYRHVKVKQAAGTYNEVSFEFRFDVGEKIDAEGTKVEAANLAFSGATAKYYDENGAQVTTLAVGNWYKVVLTPSGTTFNASFTMYPMGYYLTPRDGSQTNMTIAFRNLQAKAAS